MMLTNSQHKNVFSIRMSVLGNNTHANLDTPFYIRAVEVSTVQGVVSPLIINNGTSTSQIAYNQPIPGISTLSSGVNLINGLSVHSSYAVDNNKDLQIFQYSDPNNTLTFRQLSTGTTNITPSGGGLIALSRPGGQGMEFNSTITVPPIRTTQPFPGPGNQLNIYAINNGPVATLGNNVWTGQSGFTPSDWSGGISENLTGTVLTLNRAITGGGPQPVPPITVNSQDQAVILGLSTLTVGTMNINREDHYLTFINNNNISSLNTAYLNVNQLTELGQGLNTSSLFVSSGIKSQTANITSYLNQTVRQTLLPPPPFVPRSTTGAVVMGLNPGYTIVENKFNSKVGIGDLNYGQYYNAGYVYNRVNILNNPGSVNMCGYNVKTGRSTFLSNPGSDTVLVDIYCPCIIAFLITQSSFDLASCNRSEIFTVRYDMSSVPGQTALQAFSWDNSKGDGTYNIAIANAGQPGYPIRFRCVNVSGGNGPTTYAAWTIWNSYTPNPTQPPTQ